MTGQPAPMTISGSSSSAATASSSGSSIPRPSLQLLQPPLLHRGGPSPALTQRRPALLQPPHRLSSLLRLPATAATASSARSGTSCHMVRMGTTGSSRVCGSSSARYGSSVGLPRPGLSAANGWARGRPMCYRGDRHDATPRHHLQDQGQDLDLDGDLDQAMVGSSNMMDAAGVQPPRGEYMV